MNIQLFLGILIGYFLYSLFCPLPKKTCRMSNNKIKINGYTFHIHHWLISFLLLFIITYNKIETNEIIKGLILSGLIHGIIEYNDWYVIVKKYQPQ